LKNFNAFIQIGLQLFQNPRLFWSRFHPTDWAFDSYLGKKAKIRIAWTLIVFFPVAIYYFSRYRQTLGRINKAYGIFNRYLDSLKEQPLLKPEQIQEVPCFLQWGHQGRFDILEIQGILAEHQPIVDQINQFLIDTQKKAKANPGETHPIRDHFQELIARLAQERRPTPKPGFTLLGNTPAKMIILKEQQAFLGLVIDQKIYLQSIGFLQLSHHLWLQSGASEALEGKSLSD